MLLGAFVIHVTSPGRLMAGLVLGNACVLMEQTPLEQDHRQEANTSKYNTGQAAEKRIKVRGLGHGGVVL